MKRQKTIHHAEYCEIIDALRVERKRLGLSQATVAKKLAMSQSEISKIETYERRIDVWEFKKLIELYRISENRQLQRIVEVYFGLSKS